MKRLADFKRALTLGSKWKAIFHDKSGLNVDLGIRKVKVIHKDSIGFDNGKGGVSYLTYPKAKDYECEGDLAKIFLPEYKLEPRRLILTYQKIKG